MLAMQMRPDSSWSATFRKRSRGRAIWEENCPCRVTLLDAFKSAQRGTLIPVQNERCCQSASITCSQWKRVRQQASHAKAINRHTAE